jgi:hypothetical protein
VWRLASCGYFFLRQASCCRTIKLPSQHCVKNCAHLLILTPCQRYAGKLFELRPGRPSELVPTCSISIFYLRFRLRCNQCRMQRRSWPEDVSRGERCRNNVTVRLPGIQYRDCAQNCAQWPLGPQEHREGTLPKLTIPVSSRAERYRTCPPSYHNQL